MSDLDLRASETPPMPTSDKTGPLSDEDERKAYLELYAKSQDILDQHAS